MPEGFRVGLVVTRINWVSWVQPFLSGFEYGMVFVYLALASFGFGSPVGHYLLGGPFIFGPVESNLVKY